LFRNPTKGSYTRQGVSLACIVRWGGRSTAPKNGKAASVDAAFSIGAVLLLLLGIRLLRLVGLVDVSVEGRETAEEGYADQVLDPFYVLVEVNQGVYAFYFTYCREYFEHDSPPF